MNMDELTTEAIDRVQRNANVAWQKAAYEVVKDLSAVRRDFTTDTVWRAMELQHPELTTHEPRAMGAVMRTAARMRLIQTTGAFQKTKRPQAHGRPIAIWRTL